MRSFGPCRSAISATGRPTSFCTARIARARSAWSSWVPCEKLSRAPSITASAARARPGAEEAGPIVATIFVRRGTTAMATG